MRNPLRRGGRPKIFLLPVDRQGDDEGCSFTGFRLEIQPALVALNDRSIGDRQALASTLPNLLRGKEGVEDARPGLFRNARAGVGYADLHPVSVLPPRADGDRAFRLPVGSDHLFDGMRSVYDQV